MKKRIIIPLFFFAILLGLGLHIRSIQQSVESTYGKIDGCDDLRLWCDYPNGTRLDFSKHLCSETKGTQTLIFRCETSTMLEKLVLKANCLDYSKDWICRGDLIIASSYFIDTQKSVLIANGVEFTTDERSDSSCFLIDTLGNVTKISNEHLLEESMNGNCIHEKDSKE